MLICSIEILNIIIIRRNGSLNLSCPKYKRESEGARTFQVSAIRFWNSLSNEIKTSSSLEILKKSLYKYYISAGQTSLLQVQFSFHLKKADLASRNIVRI